MPLRLWYTISQKSVNIFTCSKEHDSLDYKKLTDKNIHHCVKFGQLAASGNNIRCCCHCVFKGIHPSIALSLHWRHNDHDGVSNHQPHVCLLKKTSKLLVTGLCVGNSPGPVNSPHKRPVTRKMFPFDDVIMWPNCLDQLTPAEHSPKWAQHVCQNSQISPC